MLHPLNVTVFDSFVNADVVQDTYVLLLAPDSSRSEVDTFTSGPSETPLIVRAVGVTAGQVRALLRSTRGYLDGRAVVSGGFRFSFRLEGSPRQVQQDTQVTNSLRTHPVFLDDEYAVYRQKV